MTSLPSLYSIPQEFLYVAEGRGVMLLHKLEAPFNFVEDLLQVSASH